MTIHLGTPPAEFFWQWTDDDKDFHRDGELTPQEFARGYVTLPLDDYVCLFTTRAEHRRADLHVEYLGNVVGAPPVTT